MGAIEPRRGEVVLALQAAMERLPAEARLEIEPVHYFADGIYGREVTLPAGSVAVGKIHKTAHLCVISKGVADVVDEFGNRRRLCAPATFVSPAGTKRAVHAIEETVWLVIHPTHETDVGKIEAKFIAPDFDALDASGALDSWVLESRGS